MPWFNFLKKKRNETPEQKAAVREARMHLGVWAVGLFLGFVGIATGGIGFPLIGLGMILIAGSTIVLIKGKKNSYKVSPASPQEKQEQKKLMKKVSQEVEPHLFNGESSEENRKDVVENTFQIEEVIKHLPPADHPRRQRRSNSLPINAIRRTEINNNEVGRGEKSSSSPQPISTEEETSGEGEKEKSEPYHPK